MPFRGEANLRALVGDAQAGRGHWVGPERRRRTGARPSAERAGVVLHHQRSPVLDVFQDALSRRDQVRASVQRPDASNHGVEPPQIAARQVFGGEQRNRGSELPEGVRNLVPSAHDVADLAGEQLDIEAFDAHRGGREHRSHRHVVVFDRPEAVLDFRAAYGHGRGQFAARSEARRRDSESCRPFLAAAFERHVLRCRFDLPPCGGVKAHASDLVGHMRREADPDLGGLSLGEDPVLASERHGHRRHHGERAGSLAERAVHPAVEHRLPDLDLHAFRRAELEDGRQQRAGTGRIRDVAATSVPRCLVPQPVRLGVARAVGDRYGRRLSGHVVPFQSPAAAHRSIGDAFQLRREPLPSRRRASQRLQLNLQATARNRVPAIRGRVDPDA